jgi:hypothetical protein
MSFAEMLRRVVLVRTDVSEKDIASITMVTIVGELGTKIALLFTANVVPNSPILVTLMMEAIHSSETLFISRTTRHHIPEDAILHSHCLGDLKSYIALTGWSL